MKKLVAVFVMFACVHQSKVGDSYGKIWLPQPRDALVDINGRLNLSVHFCGVEFDFSSYASDESEIEVRSSIDEAHQIELYDTDDNLTSSVKYSVQSTSSDEREVRLHFFHVARERMISEGIRVRVVLLDDGGNPKAVCTRDIQFRT